MAEFIGDNYIIIFFVTAGIYMFGLAIFTIRKKRKDKTFEAETPDIVKVHMENGMTVNRQDHQKLKKFSEKLHSGFYLNAGEHTLLVSFRYETYRKSVTVQEKAITIVVEASKEYDLSYDQSSEQYKFKER